MFELNIGDRLMIELRNTRAYLTIIAFENNTIITDSEYIFQTACDYYTGCVAYLVYKSTDGIYHRSNIAYRLFKSK